MKDTLLFLVTPYLLGRRNW